MKILVAYDGSESAKHALERAAQLVTNGTSVSVVSVAQVLPQVGRAAAYLDPDEVAERRREALEGKAILAEKGIKAKAVEPKGDPADAIIEEATSQGADMIVLGTRGHSAVSRWLLGSVSSRVLQHAPCDVLIVR